MDTVLHGHCICSTLCRAFLALHFTSFFCEATLVSLTLLKLLSEVHDPRFDSSDTEAVREFRINTAITTVSFAFTAVAFVGTVRGTSAFLAQLRHTVRRIRPSFGPHPPSASVKACASEAPHPRRPPSPPLPADAASCCEQSSERPCRISCADSTPETAHWATGSAATLARATAPAPPVYSGNPATDSV